MSAKIRYETLLPRTFLQARVKDLGERITRDYRDLVTEEEPLVVVCVLNGAFVFCADLIRCIHVPLLLETCRARSYDGTTRDPDVEIDYEFISEITARHVLIVEDILDTGHTLRELDARLRILSPLSLNYVTLLRKTGMRRFSGPEIKYTGYWIPNKFVLGYGLDLSGLHRNLTDVVALLPEETTTTREEIILSERFGARIKILGLAINGSWRLDQILDEWPSARPGAVWRRCLMKKAPLTSTLL